MCIVQRRCHNTVLIALIFNDNSSKYVNEIKKLTTYCKTNI